MSKREPGVQSLWILALGLLAGGLAGGLQMPWHSWLAWLAIPAAGVLWTSIPNRPALRPVRSARRPVRHR